MIRIGHVSHDLVNADHAAILAADCPIDLEPLDLHDMPLVTRFDGILLDWDSLLPADRSALLANLLAGQPRCALALYSYNLDAKEVTALRGRGVAVFRKLALE